ncbi:MAG: hypothetical protein ACTSU5_17215 [Promethearchaeota archaeon]
MSFLKAENIKLKKRVEELENELLNLSGMNKILKMEDLVNNLDSILANAQGTLRIVTPGVGKDYTEAIQKLGARGVKVTLVTNDRKTQRPELAANLDALKTAPGVEVITVEEVGMLLVLADTYAIFTGGILDKNLLLASKTMGLFTSEKGNIARLSENFNLFLPSFMR